MNSWIIKDWADNDCGFETFTSFDDAVCKLTRFIEKTYPDTITDENRFAEEFGEYCIHLKI